MTKIFWPALIGSVSLLLAVSGFSTLALNYAPAFLGPFFLIGARLLSGSWPRLDWPLYGWMAGICFLMLLSSSWSQTPAEALRMALSASAIILLSLPLIDLARAAPESVLQEWKPLIGFAILTAGLVPLAQLLYFSRQANIDLSFLNANISVFVLMLPVALLFCHKAGLYTVSLALCLEAMMIGLFTHSYALQIALLSLPLGWALLVILPGAGIPVAFGFTIMLALLMPWLIPLGADMFGGTGSRVALRLESWDDIARQIHASPWTGAGFNAAPAQNVALDLWLKFGLAGVGPVCALLCFLMVRLFRLREGQRRIPLTVFCVGTTLLMLSASVFEGWMIGLIISLAASMILAARTSSGRATS